MKDKFNRFLDWLWGRPVISPPPDTIWYKYGGEVFKYRKVEKQEVNE